MRDFRTFVNDPVGNDPADFDFLGAININNFLGELKTFVIRSGQTLTTDNGEDDPNKSQMAEAMFINAVKALSFQDNGTANAYVLTPLSGANGVKVPANYTNLNGAAIQFTPANDATGASTVNIGQTAATAAGALPLTNADGSALTTGDVLAGDEISIKFFADDNNGNGAWRIQPWSSIGNVLRNSINATLNAGFYPSPLDLGSVTGTVTPVFLNRNHITFTATGTVNLANPVSSPPGGMCVVYGLQDATGGRILSFGTNYNTLSGSWSIAANAVNIMWMTFQGNGQIDVVISQRT